MIKPITPREVIGKKKELLPDAVLEAFNELIAKHWNNGEACFKQDEVVALICQKLEQELNKGGSSDDNWMSVRKQEIFDNHYLDVEGIYRKAGWTVNYDSPAYCESYPATFTFRSKKSKS